MPKIQRKENELYQIQKHTKTAFDDWHKIPPVDWKKLYH
ncbi:hypothetical protein DYY67_0881 [Candidatus Nitrosotalea sp. TS]|nr:hypothetical protein [Candidatus Nitrosotalea sp. TS]